MLKYKEQKVLRDYYWYHHEVPIAKGGVGGSSNHQEQRVVLGVVKTGNSEE